MPARPKRKSSRAEPAPHAQSRARLEQVAQAVDAFRRGAAVRLVGEDDSVLLALAVETATDDALDRLASKPGTPSLLLLTHARARTLGIRLYTPDVVAIATQTPLRAPSLRAIADPTDDLSTPLKGPFEALRGMQPASYPLALKLAKLAGLLPAVVVRESASDRPDVPAVSLNAIARHEEDSVTSLALVTRAQVPLQGADRTELVAFRAGTGEPEHYAILVGAPPLGRPVLTRLHSECFTGDLLASLKCDCGAQLRGAIDVIARAGAGVLLYLAQEGRGIGLINKLRAYRLQDQGFDTLEANERLGFEADERLYGIAARMLTLLGYVSVRLLTNNPAKVEALEAAGVRVVERVPHAFPGNVHSLGYLRTKALKAGHLL